MHCQTLHLWELGVFMILQGLLQFWITRMVGVQLSCKVIGRIKLNPLTTPSNRWISSESKDSTKPNNHKY